MISLISVVQMRSNDVVYGYKNDYAWQRWMQEEVCSLYNIFKPMIQPGEIIGKYKTYMYMKSTLT